MSTSNSYTCPDNLNCQNLNCIYYHDTPHKCCPLCDYDPTEMKRLMEEARIVIDCSDFDQEKARAKAEAHARASRASRASAKAHARALALAKEVRNIVL